VRFKEFLQLVFRGDAVPVLGGAVLPVVPLLPGAGTRQLLQRLLVCATHGGMFINGLSTNCPLPCPAKKA